MKLTVLALALLGVAHGAKIGGGPTRGTVQEPEVEIQPVVVRATGRGSLALAAAGVCGSAAIAAAPAARKAVAHLFRGGSTGGGGEEEEPAAPAAVATKPKPTTAAAAGTSREAAAKSTAKAVARQSEDAAAPSGKPPSEQLVLSPERLAQIGKLSDLLTPLADELGMVPAFTVTVGNTSAPLTIPHGDGERLAYFFVECVGTPGHCSGIRATAVF